MKRCHLDVFEVKQVSLHKGAEDLLIGPCDEQLVIVISLRLPWQFIGTYTVYLKTKVLPQAADMSGVHACELVKPEP